LSAVTLFFKVMLKLLKDELVLYGVTGFANDQHISTAKKSFRVCLESNECRASLRLETSA
jgi:hypothetical protein